MSGLFNATITKISGRKIQVSVQGVSADISIGDNLNLFVGQRVPIQLHNGQFQLLYTQQKTAVEEEDIFMQWIMLGADLDTPCGFYYGLQEDKDGYVLYRWGQPIEDVQSPVPRKFTEGRYSYLTYQWPSPIYVIEEGKVKSIDYMTGDAITFDNEDIEYLRADKYSGAFFALGNQLLYKPSSPDYPKFFPTSFKRAYPIESPTNEINSRWFHRVDNDIYSFNDTSSNYFYKYDTSEKESSNISASDIQGIDFSGVEYNTHFFGINKIINGDKDISKISTAGDAEHIDSDLDVEFMENLFFINFSPSASNTTGNIYEETTEEGVVGRIYSPPEKGTTIHVLNTKDESTYTIGNLGSCPYPLGKSRWGNLSEFVGDVAYANAAYGKVILKIDASNDTYTTFGNFTEFVDKWYANAASGSYVYGMPHTVEYAIRINTANDTYTTFGNVGTKVQKTARAITAENGAVYTAPYLQQHSSGYHSVMKAQGTTLSEISCGAGSWVGMAYNTEDKCIYAVPHGRFGTVTRIMRINTLTDAISFIDIGYNFVSGGGAAVADNNVLYMPPATEHNYCLAYNIDSGEIYQIPIGFNSYPAGIFYNKTLYMGPTSSNYACLGGQNRFETYPPKISGNNIHIPTKTLGTEGFRLIFNTSTNAFSVYKHEKPTGEVIPKLPILLDKIYYISNQGYILSIDPSQNEDNQGVEFISIPSFNAAHAVTDGTKIYYTSTSSNQILIFTPPNSASLFTPKITVNNTEYTITNANRGSFYKDGLLYFTDFYWNRLLSLQPSNNECKLHYSFNSLSGSPNDNIVLDDSIFAYSSYVYPDNTTKTSAIFTDFNEILPNFLGANTGDNFQENGIVFIQDNHIYYTTNYGRIFILSEDDEPIEKNWTQVAMGDEYILALEGDTLWEIKKSDGEQKQITEVVVKKNGGYETENKNSFTYVAARGNTYAAIDRSKHLYMWGDNTSNRCGYEGTSDKPKEVDYKEIGNKRWSKVYVFKNFTQGLDMNGKIFTWGDTDNYVHPLTEEEWEAQQE